MARQIRCEHTTADGTRCQNPVKKAGDWCRRCKAPERALGGVPAAQVARMAGMAAGLGEETTGEDWCVDLTFTGGSALASVMDQRVQALRDHPRD